MRLIMALLALGLLGGRANADGIAKRYTLYNSMDDFSYLGMLSKRDECSDAFGSNAQNSICVPDSTLCCIRSAQAFPSCQQYLGRGWCCTGENDDDGCYLDSASFCGDDGAVPCTNLRPGIKKACCMKGTTCDPDTVAGPESVRCTIPMGDLIDLADADADASASTSVSTATSTSSETATGDTTVSATSTGDGDSSDKGGLPGGTIAGIAVGGAGAAVLIGILLYIVIQRRKMSKTKYQAANQGPQGQPPHGQEGSTAYYGSQQGQSQHGQEGVTEYYDPQQAKPYEQTQHGYYQQQGYHEPYPSSSSPQPPPQELSTRFHSPGAELSAATRPVEMENYDNSRS